MQFTLRHEVVPGECLVIHTEKLRIENGFDDIFAQMLRINSRDHFAAPFCTAIVVKNSSSRYSEVWARKLGRSPSPGNRQPQQRRKTALRTVGCGRAELFMLNQVRHVRSSLDHCTKSAGVLAEGIVVRHPR